MVFICKLTAVPRARLRAPRTRLPVGLLACLILVLGRSAHAQEAVQSQTDAGASDAATATPAAPLLTPPQLLEEVAPVYPEEGLAQRLEVTIGLKASIDAQGQVTQVEVTESGGAVFDEAA